MGRRRSTSRSSRCASGRSRTPRMWMRDYGIDGLRLDAVFAIYDDSEPHVLRELAEPRARGEAGRARDRRGWRPDDERADRGVGASTPSGPTSSTTSCTSLLTGETRRLLRGLRLGVAASPAQLERPAAGAVRRLLAEPRPGRQPRLRRPARAAELRARAAIVLFAPQTPLLFMGEEYGERAPFHVLHRPRSTRDRRGDARGAQARVRALRGFAGDVPDPQAPETFDALEARRARRCRGCATSTATCSRLRRELPREIETKADDVARTLRARRGEHDARGRLRARRTASVRVTRGLARPPVPARRDLGRARARTSRSSPSTPSASSSACSTPTTTRRASS